MAASSRNVAFLSLRGSCGVWLVAGPPHYADKPGFPRTDSKLCRTMAFSRDGNIFAYCDARCVRVTYVPDNVVLCEINKPRTSAIVISPCGTFVATWEPYAVMKDQPAGTPNLNLWSSKTGQHIKGFIQKKQSGWCPQWSADEQICARNVNNEVHFFENNDFDTIVNKLHLQKVSDFSLPEKCLAPYHVAAYVPGAKGQPSFVRVYKYPDFGGPNSALANKSFYKADKVDLLWNNKGTALLVLTTCEVSADSYYGEQGLHFISINGESCLVPRNKKGPVYSVEWSPDSSQFCVVYGLMPAKATLYNLKSEAVFDYGTGPRNAVYFNPQGNMLVLAGFGNLRGNVEFWDLKTHRLISNPKCPDSTFFEWSPDGMHIVTATTSPRLRVGNGFKIWDYTGALLYEADMEEGQELWQVEWQPALDGVFHAPRLAYKPTDARPGSSAGPKIAGVTEDSVYVPPHMRGKAKSLQGRPKLRDDYEPPSNMKQEPQVQENMSKAALKNKKKREAKQRAKEQGEGGAVGGYQNSYSPSGASAQPSHDRPSTGADPDKDKKIRNLRKKIQAIEKLKEQQSAGKQLEKNQLEKLSTEATLLKELEELTL